MQGEWDEEKDPEGFRLGGTAPVAKADAPASDNAAGRLSDHTRFFESQTDVLQHCT